MKNQGSSQPSTSQAAQTASVRSVPASTGRHNDPKVMPVGGKAMTGFKAKK